MTNAEFELLASEFYLATGYLAPGKDYPPEMQPTVEPEVIRALWREFLAKRPVRDQPKEGV